MTIHIASNGTATSVSAATGVGDPATNPENFITFTELASIANTGGDTDLRVYGNGDYVESGTELLEITYGGSAGNAVIIQPAAGNSPVLRKTGAQVGVEYATGVNYVTVMLDVATDGSVGTGQFVHTSGTAGSSGDGHNIVFAGNITGSGGTALDGDGISLDGTSQLVALLTGKVISDVQATSPTFGSPQAFTPHTTSSLRVIGGTIRDVNTFMQTGDATTAKFYSYGTVYKNALGAGFGYGGTTESAFIVGGSVDMLTTQRPFAISGSGGKLIFSAVKLELGATIGAITALLGELAFVDCITNDYNTSMRFLPNSAGRQISILRGRWNFKGAQRTTEFIRSQSGGSQSLKGVIFDFSEYQGTSMTFSAEQATSSTGNELVGCLLIGAEDTEIAVQISQRGGKVSDNTLYKLGDSTSNARVLNIGNGGEVPEVKNNIFYDCKRSNSNPCVLDETTGDVADVDFNNFSGGSVEFTADTNRNTFDPEFVDLKDFVPGNFDVLEAGTNWWAAGSEMPPISVDGVKPEIGIPQGARLPAASFLSSGGSGRELFIDNPIR